MQIPVDLSNPPAPPHAETSAAALPPLSILDLRHYSAESLRPVLEAESVLWRKRLNWDYTASCKLLLQYFEARILPGFVAVENGRVVGYTFCVYEDRKAVVGDVFAVSGAFHSSDAIERALLEHLLSLLKHSPGVERIEAQLLIHTHDLHGRAFRDAGFRLHRRTYMERELGPAQPEQEAARLSHLSALGYDLRSWGEADFQPAGSLIANAYEGHVDASINDQYCSVAGALRFLHNIIRFPGCGIFDPAASLVLTARGTGATAGMVLCSRVENDVQHITQLCVASRARGAGIGTLLLESAAERLGARGFRTLSLTVTDDNQRAAALYRRLRFVERHSFDAMVWTADKERALRTKRKPDGTLPHADA